MRFSFAVNETTVIDAEDYDYYFAVIDRSAAPCGFLVEAYRDRLI